MNATFFLPKSNIKILSFLSKERQRPINKIVKFSKGDIKFIEEKVVSYLIKIQQKKITNINEIEN